MPPTKHRPADRLPPLLAWFAGHARDLPWRRTLDPYAVWVSEIMLQQTQVRTVMPYFERWLRELPDIAALAAAPEARVLKLWEGLGYYSRARNLQRAAREIMARHDGRFPREPAAILALPGIGRYTAGAIASIAFNQPEPILDGNVFRVLTRWFALAGDPKATPLNNQLWAFAGELVAAAADLPAVRLPKPLHLAGNCSALNQALMELGAILCTPAAPRCDDCPVRRHCEAARQGTPERFPTPARRPETTARRFVAVVLRKDDRHWVRQRAAAAVNGGFWEFPNQELTADTSSARTAAARWLELPPDVLESLTTIRHSITRYRITVEVFAARVRTLPASLAGDGRWVEHRELAELALTAAHRKIAGRLGTHSSTPHMQAVR